MYIDSNLLLNDSPPTPFSQTTMVHFKYEWGRYSRCLYDPPPPPAKFAAGIARCPSPKRTATFKYPRIP